MAATLTSPGGNLTFVGDVQNITFPFPALTVPIIGKGAYHYSFTLSTVGVALAKGNIGNIGWVYIKNLDVTNNVLVCADNTNYVAGLIIPPGQYYNGPWGQPSIAAKSSAGAPNIEVFLFEL